MSVPDNLLAVSREVLGVQRNCKSLDIVIQHSLDHFLIPCAKIRVPARYSGARLRLLLEHEYAKYTNEDLVHYKSIYVGPETNWYRTLIFFKNAFPSQNGNNLGLVE